jgi:hypothetical protein
MVISAIVIRDDLRSRGVISTADWLKSRNIKLVMHTRDDRLMRGLRGRDCLASLGVTFFKLEKWSEKPNYLIQIEPWTLLEAFDRGQLPIRDELDYKTSSNGYSLRSSAELD